MDDELVRIRHKDVAGEGLVPAASVDHWETLDWTVVVPEVEPVAELVEVTADYLSPDPSPELAAADPVTPSEDEVDD